MSTAKRIILSLWMFSTSLFAISLRDYADLEQQARALSKELVSLKDLLLNLRSETRYYYPPMSLCQGRITVTSNTPYINSSANQGTIYFTPTTGSTIGLYDGSSNWQILTFAQISLALSISSGSNYDVFVYNNAGTLALELSSAWTNDTTRADALAMQDGEYVKDSDKTRRYVGTIRGSAANKVDDTPTKRFVWNYCNKWRTYGLIQGSSTWALSGTAWRAANASTSYRVALVRGINDTLVTARAVIGVNSSSGSEYGFATGVGVDSTTVNSATLFGDTNKEANSYEQSWAQYAGYPGIGYHYLQWLERAVDSGASGNFAGSVAGGSGGVSGNAMTMGIMVDFEG